jgi:hypothetical protein
LRRSVIIPPEVENFARSLPSKDAVALIGCRASGLGSLDCCEYDLAVFSEKPSNSQVVRLQEHTVELIYVGGRPASNAESLYGMRIVRDAGRLALASAAKEITPEKHARALAAAARKQIVSSLLYLSRMADKSEKSEALVPVWAKVAAYHFMSGAIELAGSRPMPLHELEQSRQMDASGAVADGMEAALDCIGTERATRPAISRSLEALRELKSEDYDRDLVMAKIEFLLGRQMLSDCYYYVGKIAAASLVGRKESYLRRYYKLVQLALDLSSDSQHLEKLRRQLFRSANVILKG